MKILLVSEYWTPVVYGGGEISAEHLANSLVKRGIQTSVLTSRIKKEKSFEVRNKVKIYRTLKTGNPKSFLGNLRRLMFFQKSLKKNLFKLDKKENFNAIHFLNTTSIPNFRIRKKTIATINSYTNFCPKGNLFFEDKKVCKNCNFLKYLNCMFNSAYLGKLKLNFYLKYNPLFLLFVYLNYKKRNKALKNVGLFIAISDFINSLLKKSNYQTVKLPNICHIEGSGLEYKFKKEGVVVAYIGALEKIKGVRLLVKSFNQVKNKAKLIVVGEGPERKYLEKIANENVLFTGKLDYKYMPSIYKQSDIIALPSVWPEPLSRILMEATYFGKPVVAMDVGGNSEGVKDKINGFFFSNEKELENKLKQLIFDSGLRLKMGKNSKKLFQRYFDKNQVIKKMIKLYSE